MVTLKVLPDRRSICSVVVSIAVSLPGIGSYLCLVVVPRWPRLELVPYADTRRLIWFMVRVRWSLTLLALIFALVQNSVAQWSFTALLPRSQCRLLADTPMAVLPRSES